MAVVLMNTLQNRIMSLHAKCRQLPYTKQQVSNVLDGSNNNELTPTIMIGSSKWFSWLMSHKALKKKEVKKGMTKPSITFEVFSSFNYDIQTPPHPTGPRLIKSQLRMRICIKRCQKMS